jgi:hypothetical protein
LESNFGFNEHSNKEGHYMNEEPVAAAWNMYYCYLCI